MIPNDVFGEMLIGRQVRRRCLDLALLLIYRLGAVGFRAAAHRDMIDPVCAAGVGPSCGAFVWRRNGHLVRARSITIARPSPGGYKDVAWQLFATWEAIET